MYQSVALQLWTIRNALAADPHLALAKVKAAGFESVEIAPLSDGLTPERLAEILKGLELGVVSIHGDLPTPRNICQWKHWKELFSCSKIVWHGWPRDPRFDSLAGLKALIQKYNKAGAIARDHGFSFGLHNHWWEFEPIQGERPIRLLDEWLDSAIFWQLDVYWVQTAGIFPVQVIQDLGDRLGSVHWKDGPAILGEPMTALGQGKVDIPGILQSLKKNVDWVIELDECATDPFEAARESREYLEKLSG